MVRGLERDGEGQGLAASGHRRPRVDVEDGGGSPQGEAFDNTTDARGRDILGDDDGQVLLQGWERWNGPVVNGIRDVGQQRIQVQLEHDDVGLYADGGGHAGG